MKGDSFIDREVLHFEERCSNIGRTIAKKGGSRMSRKVWILAFTTILLWGSTFAAIRASLLGGYTPGHLILVRYSVASLAFVFVAMLPGKKIRMPDRKDIPLLALLGFIGISVYHAGITFGEMTVSAGAVGMMIGAAPIVTAIIAVLFLKEKLGGIGWTGMGIGFAGIILITLGTAEGFSISVGAVYVLISVIATSVFFAGQKPFLRKYKPVELVAYFSWAGTIPFLIFSPGVVDTVTQATTEANASAVYAGIFPAAIAYVTWSTALSLGDASKVTSMMYLEPAVAVITAWIWLGEWPSGLSLIGGAVALAGVIVVQVLGGRKKRKLSRAA